MRKTPEIFGELGSTETSSQGSLVVDFLLGIFSMGLLFPFTSLAPSHMQSGGMENYPTVIVVKEPSGLWILLSGDCVMAFFLGLWRSSMYQC